MKVHTFNYELIDASNDSAEWTLLIAAAGNGTRLGADVPKILYPVKGVSILSRILRNFVGLCKINIVVTNQESQKKIIKYCSEQGIKINIQVIKSSQGMADTIAHGLKSVTSKYLIVMWGDQPAISRNTVSKMIKIMMEKKSICCMPIVRKKNPYISFDISPQGKIRGILQAREGSRMPDIGIGDCGIFSFQTDYLQESLKKQRVTFGEKTGEWNFLPILPVIDSLQDIDSFYVGNETEALGLNTFEDLIALEKFIR
jgi:bifunctional N-acetylglucosamine-1-phosphate-uridyltransferase/glucosamine-1-phosphate-acetyltransferase GlmU-like protein